MCFFFLVYSSVVSSSTVFIILLKYFKTQCKNAFYVYEKKGITSHIDSFGRENTFMVISYRKHSRIIFCT